MLPRPEKPVVDVMNGIVRSDNERRFRGKQAQVEGDSEFLRHISFLIRKKGEWKIQLLLEFLVLLNRVLADPDNFNGRFERLRGLHRCHTDLMMSGKLRDVLIVSVGADFDPPFHEAFERVDAPGKKPGAIVSEYQKGYLFQNRLLRPALVSVASGESNDGDEKGVARKAAPRETEDATSNEAAAEPFAALDEPSTDDAADAPTES